MIARILSKPIRIAVFCFIVAALHILIDGTAFQIWSLHSEKRELERRIANGGEDVTRLGKQIKSAQRLEYVERQARDQLELVQDGDLIFVFSDEVRGERAAAAQ